MATNAEDRAVNLDEPMSNDGVKRQPHERDETPDAQDQEPRGIMKQAASDLEQGLIDTEARGTPGISVAVDAAPGASGQATPLPDRHRDMRDHEAEPAPEANEDDNDNDSERK